MQAAYLKSKIALHNLCLCLSISVQQSGDRPSEYLSTIWEHDLLLIMKILNQHKNVYYLVIC